MNPNLFLVFDQSEENCLPWADIYRDYKTLVKYLTKIIEYRQLSVDKAG